MWVSVWLVVKLPTQKLQRGDRLMPATHRMQSAISLTSTYVTNKAESGMNTHNFNCKSRWGSADPPQGSRQPCSTKAILWESWRGASSAVGELWEMFTKKNREVQSFNPTSNWPIWGFLCLSPFHLHNNFLSNSSWEAAFDLRHDNWQLWSWNRVVMTWTALMTP